MTGAALKCVVGAAAAAVALGAPRGQVARREMQSIQLCNTASQNTPAMIVSRCDMATSPALGASWDTCCSFGQDSQDLCRTYTMEGSYCATCDLNGQGKCTALSVHDTLTINMNFTQKAGDESCCKTCTCYGDPECVAFNGVADLWIPCDARTSSSCNPTKSGCLAQTGPNQRACNWIRSDRSDSAGWNTALYGSPCVPVNVASDPIMMNMYTQVKPAAFSADLRLGERGVILDLNLGGASGTFKMNAESCFAQSGAASWAGGKMPAGATFTTSQAGTQISWMFMDNKAKVFVRFQCIRAVSGSTVGAARLNVQEITATSTATGDGFCVSGAINDKSGSTNNSPNLHAVCTTDVPTALQACKNLVSQSMTDRDYQICAQMYCAMSASGQQKCLNAIGSGSNDAGWQTAYCLAVQANNPKISLSTCKKNVGAQGYPWAVVNYGDGQKTATPGERECGTSLQQYLYKNKASCEDGVTLEIQMADGSWTPYLWFPVASPPCNGALVVSGTDANAEPLFSHPIRMTQCDVRADPVCANVSPCSTTYGAKFSLAFDNLQRQLTQLYNQGALLCSPAGNPPSQTWCLPGSSDYQPQKFCPCPTGNGRLLLMGQSAIDNAM
jgi:hypothetical protein